jgi:hypothetical protein
MRLLWVAPGLIFAATAPAPVFTDVTTRAGITWRHFNGASADHFLVESTTGGAGFLDFDQDGLPDIFLVNGGETPHGKSPTPVRCALYRNLGGGRFTDVAAKAGVDRLPFYGMGVAAADYDNDGYPDLYVTGYPAGALFHNNRNGTFTNVTATAGVANQGEWGASAAWFDYDRDGRLDLFIANYVQFSYDDPKHCEFAGEMTYCAQTAYQGSRCRLYHNNGDGTFTDVSERSGVAQSAGRALGVVAVDANDDGWVDLFVARDASPNLLLLNQGDGTFRDAGLEAEIAYNPDGVARSGMGVDAGDVNGDGLPDFVVTNFDNEYHALYLSTGKLPYREATAPAGLARATRPYVGWGVRFLDFDNDGWLDLLIVNGHLHRQIALSNRNVTYREPPLLLANNSKGVFERVGARAGAAFQNGYLGRGLATGDIDNDGAVDALFVDLNGSPVLLRNTGARGNGWVGVEPRGGPSNRDAIGAKLTLHHGPATLTRWITGGGSFLASHDRRVVFGLGATTEPPRLEIRWPDGRTEAVSKLERNRYNRIVEQDGK